MTFIELYNESGSIWVKINSIEIIKKAQLQDRPRFFSCIYVSGLGHNCKETPEEILQKIIEAEKEVINNEQTIS
jgi:hypothetical protein